MRDVRRLPLDSTTADIFERPLRKGLFGVTKMDTYPFQIMLNSKILGSRQAISLVHEMLHVFMKLHKMEGFSHSRLHDLAVFIFGEILPVMKKYHSLKGQGEQEHGKQRSRSDQEGNVR